MDISSHWSAFTVNLPAIAMCMNKSPVDSGPSFSSGKSNLTLGPNHCSSFWSPGPHKCGIKILSKKGDKC